MTTIDLYIETRAIWSEYPNNFFVDSSRRSSLFVPNTPAKLLVGILTTCKSRFPLRSIEHSMLRANTTLGTLPLWHGVHNRYTVIFSCLLKALV